MKTILSILAAVISISSFADNLISPTRDLRGFIGGTFTGNASGMTNYLGTNYFGEFRITDFANHITTELGNDAQQITNWNSSVSFGVGVNASLGYLTNNLAGFWKISGEFTFNADDIENYNFSIYSNNVEVVGTTRSFTIAGASYNGAVPISYTTYLPANTIISIRALTDLASSTNKVTFGVFRIERQ